MNLQDAIESLRGAEVPETAAIVLQDPDLQRVLAAWPMVAVRRMESVSAAEWEQVWAAAKVDESALHEMTGLQAGRAQVAFRRAVALRLIYPDGSLHRHAKMVLQKQIKDALVGRK